MEYDPAVRDRIEQLIAELRTAEDPAEKARVRAELDKLIFDIDITDALAAREEANRKGTKSLAELRADLERSDD